MGIGLAVYLLGMFFMEQPIDHTKIYVTPPIVTTNEARYTTRFHIEDEPTWAELIIENNYDNIIIYGDDSFKGKNLFERCYGLRAGDRVEIVHDGTYIKKDIVFYAFPDVKNLLIGANYESKLYVKSPLKGDTLIIQLTGQSSADIVADYDSVVVLTLNNAKLTLSGQAKTLEADIRDFSMLDINELITEHYEISASHTAIIKGK